MDEKLKKMCIQSMIEQGYAKMDSSAKDGFELTKKGKERVLELEGYNKNGK